MMYDINYNVYLKEEAKRAERYYQMIRDKDFNDAKRAYRLWEEANKKWQDYKKQFPRVAF